MSDDVESQMFMMLFFLTITCLLFLFCIFKAINEPDDDDRGSESE